MNSHSRHERGATAILFAIFATLFFTVAALGVDLGNAMTRKRDVQTQADLAALAGGAELPADAFTPAASDDPVLAVAKYLIKNRVYDDLGSVTIPAFGPTDTDAERNAKINALATKLVSSIPVDIAAYGHVYYGSFDASGTFVPSKNVITVLAPHRRISFGLARVAGFDHVDVRAKATAAIRSPGSVAAMPFYAYTGCDWGQQIISHSTQNPTAPDVANDSEKNDAALAAPSAAAPNLSPNVVAINDVSTTLSLAGTGLDSVTRVGFFRGDASAPITIAKGSFLSQSDTKITFTLSAAPTVSSKTDTLYVRVEAPNKNKGLAWSAVSTSMAYLNVGDATLFCNDGKSSGNFGSLTVARSDSNNSASGGWLPLNIAKGLDLPNVGVTLYDAAVNDDSCTNKDGNAVQSDQVRTDINCLVTDTGFPQNPATNGLITGVSGTPPTAGRLTKIDSGCSGDGVLGTPPTRANVAGVTINNELLSCYFTNSTTTVAQVSNQSYNGDVVISPSIFSSPRFFWVPVLPKQASSGKSSYPLIDFRAAFLTGENGAATRNHPADPAYYWDDSVTNGLVMDKNHVDSFRVVFINPKALPPDSNGGSPVDYTGSGTKLLFLID